MAQTRLPTRKHLRLTAGDAGVQAGSGACGWSAGIAGRAFPARPADLRIWAQNRVPVPHKRNRNRGIDPRRQDGVSEHAASHVAMVRDEPVLRGGLVTGQGLRAVRGADDGAERIEAGRRRSRPHRECTEERLNHKRIGRDNRNPQPCFLSFRAQATARPVHDK